jgi:hypothetical protein
MSRYTQIEGSIETTLGWDPPLDTFFLIQKDIGKEDEENEYIICWKGMKYQEISTIDKFKSICEQHQVVLSKELEEALIRDSLVPHQPSPLQLLMRKMTL